MNFVTLILLLAIAAAPRVSRASEGELQLATGAVIGGSQGGNLPLSLTYGGEFSVTWSFTDWVAIEGLMYGLRTAEARDAQANISYDSWLLGAAPLLHWMPPAHLWPRVFTGRFVPSIDMGMGLSVEWQRNRRRGVNGIYRKRADAAWSTRCELVFGVGFDVEVARGLALAFRTRALLPITAPGEQFTLLATLGISFPFYLD